MKKIISAVLTAAFMVSFSPMCVYADEWVQNDNGYVYQYDDGTTAPKGWLKLGDKTYYIQKDGTRKTGWLTTSSGNKYYFGKDGAMYKNKWVTFKSGSKYYFDSKGVMATGSKTISGNTYYFSKDGIMKTGWLKSNGNWYYFRKDGTMAKNCSLSIDGVIYSFDKSGKSDTEPNLQEELKEFNAPKFGTSKEKVLKECGITDYVEDKDKNTCTGKVLFGGIESYLVLKFSSADKLKSYLIAIPANYGEYLIFLTDFKKALGYDYLYNKEANSYTWCFSDGTIVIEYDDNNKAIEYYISKT